MKNKRNKRSPTRELNKSKADDEDDSLELNERMNTKCMAHCLLEKLDLVSGVMFK